MGPLVICNVVEVILRPRDLFRGSRGSMGEQGGPRGSRGHPGIPWGHRVGLMSLLIFHKADMLEYK